MGLPSAMLVPRAGAQEFRGMRDVMMLCVTCGDVMSAETLTEPPRPDIKLQPLPFHRMMEAQVGAGVSK